MSSTPPPTASTPSLPKIKFTFNKPKETASPTEAKSAATAPLPAIHNAPTESHFVGATVRTTTAPNASSLNGATPTQDDASQPAKIRKPRGPPKGQKRAKTLAAAAGKQSAAAGKKQRKIRVSKASALSVALIGGAPLPTKSSMSQASDYA